MAVVDGVYDPVFNSGEAFLFKFFTGYPPPLAKREVMLAAADQVLAAAGKVEVCLRAAVLPAVGGGSVPAAGVLHADQRG
jgi:hypothetical protein